jgi:hypothetical protein
MNEQNTVNLILGGIIIALLIFCGWLFKENSNLQNQIAVNTQTTQKIIDFLNNAIAQNIKQTQTKSLNNNQPAQGQSLNAGQ